MTNVLDVDPSPNVSNDVFGVDGGLFVVIGLGGDGLVIRIGGQHHGNRVQVVIVELDGARTRAVGLLKDVDSSVVEVVIDHTHRILVWLYCLLVKCDGICVKPNSHHPTLDHTQLCEWPQRRRVHLRYMSDPFEGGSGRHTPRSCRKREEGWH